MAETAAGWVAGFAILGTGLWLLTLWQARRREAAAEAGFPPEGTVVTVNGRAVHAVIRGDGPDLVMIHGASGNTRDLTLSPLMELAREFRVIVFDRPGFGWSDRLPRGHEDAAAQARHLADAAAQLGARRPVVLGHSYGGAVALAWALERPRALAALVTLAGPSHPWPGPPPLLHRLTGRQPGSALLVPLLTAWVPARKIRREIESIFPPQPVPDAYATRIGAGLTLRRHSLRANACQRLTLKDEIRAMVPRYPSLTLPLELVHGEADTTVGLDIHARPMAAQAPSARLTALPGIGHMPHHAAPAAVVAAVRRAATRAGLAPGGQKS